MLHSQHGQSMYHCWWSSCRDMFTNLRINTKWFCYIRWTAATVIHRPLVLARVTHLASKTAFLCVISRFCREVEANCALLGYYAASSGNFFTDLSGQPVGPIFKGQEERSFSLQCVVLNTATAPCRLQATPSQPLVAPQYLFPTGQFNLQRVTSGHGSPAVYSLVTPPVAYTVAGYFLNP